MKYLITESQMGNISNGIERLLTNLFSDNPFVYKITVEPVTENYDSEDDDEFESIEIYIVFNDVVLSLSEQDKHSIRIMGLRIARDYVEKFFPSIKFGVYSRVKGPRD